jgi:hypothetical protein
MARSSECTEQYAQKVIDSADIVREAMFQELAIQADLSEPWPGPCRRYNRDVTTEIEGRDGSEFRLVVAIGFVAGTLVPAGAAIAEHGLATWVMVAISLCIAAVAIWRLRKERVLLAGRATTAATVTHWERTDGGDGGYSYCVRYQFRVPGGKQYLGKAKSQVWLPQQGEMIPVSYLSVDPTQSLPLATFWFYRFTYTGFAKWIDS